MKYPDIFAKYDTEYEKLKNIKKIKEEIAALDGQKFITRPENELRPKGNVPRPDRIMCQVSQKEELCPRMQN